MFRVALVCEGPTDRAILEAILDLPDHTANIPCEPEHTGRPCIECRRDVKRLLRDNAKQLGVKLVTMKQGTLRNHAPAYRRIQDRITQGWTRTVKSCTQAARFDADLGGAIA